MSLVALLVRHTWALRMLLLALMGLRMSWLALALGTALEQRTEHRTLWKELVEVRNLPKMLVQYKPLAQGRAHSSLVPA